MKILFQLCLSAFLFPAAVFSAAAGAGPKTLPEILNSVEGAYTGSADTDYSFHDFYKPRTPLRINIAYDDYADQLLVHVSQQNGAETLCSLFIGIELTTLSPPPADVKAEDDSGFIRYLIRYDYPATIKSADNIINFGAVKDAVMVTQLEFHNYNENDPLTLGMTVGEHGEDRQAVGWLEKIKNSPDKSFRALKDECYDQLQ